MNMQDSHCGIWQRTLTTAWVLYQPQMCCVNKIIMIFVIEDVMEYDRLLHMVNINYVNFVT